MCCDMYVWRGGGGDLFYFIIIKMASVFKLPDVNVLCVWGAGGGGGGGEGKIMYLLY